MQVCYNGQFSPAAAPLFTADNRGFKYGDGLFETARVVEGRLLLADYHFERLLYGLQKLQIKHPPEFTAAIQDFIQELCRQNGCSNSARIRLAVFRGAESEAQYLIEAGPEDLRSSALASQGWAIDVYEDALKTCDSFANLKSANYLPYLMAQRYSLEKGLDECLVLNSRKTIADGAKTNLFVLMDDTLYTPPLSAGCVAGVMRRHVINRLEQLRYVVKEEDLEVTMLHQASEVFVTNAIEGIRWVKSFGKVKYRNEWIKETYQALLSGI